MREIDERDCMNGRADSQRLNNLSSRVRPDVEAAPWVIDEIKKLEAKVLALQSWKESTKKVLREFSDRVGPRWFLEQGWAEPLELLNPPPLTGELWQPVDTAPKDVRVRTRRKTPSGILESDAVYTTVGQTTGWHVDENCFIWGVYEWQPLKLSGDPTQHKYECDTLLSDGRQSCNCGSKSGIAAMHDATCPFDEMNPLKLPEKQP